MKNKQIYLSILAVALALGTAWAVRGKFGHEQGAAWAGAIGALSVILVAKRNDWYNKTFKIALAAAFGWGISGVISYGVVVGYGRGVDFVNVYYGFLMLFVIGVLYGFLGGGIFGLALIDSKTVKVKWHALLAEMVALGLLTYALLINQLEWFMTPPRSEMWAACLGAGIAVAWYIVRHQQASVLKVAVWSAIGAGFGFAFGNFLQVMGSVSGIQFNFWNVMEYSLGFFGGIGMAYGTFTSHWPVSDDKPTPNLNLIPILLLVCFIPFVVWDQSFVSDRFQFILEDGGSPTTVFYIKLIAIAAIIVVAILIITRNYPSMKEKTVANSYRVVKNLFLLYLGLYIFLSFLVTGLYTHPPEQYFYLINFAVILFILPRLKGTFEVQENKPRTWILVTFILIVALAFLAAIAMNSHGELQGSQIRFNR